MNWMVKRRIIIKSLLFVVLCALTANSYATEKEMRRIMVGLKLFPAVIAADYDVTKKKDANGYLSLCILHEDSHKLAKDLKKRLQRINNIKKIPIKVKTFTFSEFINKKEPDSMACFLAEPPNSGTQKILDHSITLSVLLFSPFKGDVEKGIHSGFIVSDRILPYVNLNTMQQSRIKLKAFFLRVSKHYD